MLERAGAVCSLCKILERGSEEHFVAGSLDLGVWFFVIDVALLEHSFLLFDLRVFSHFVQFGLMLVQNGEGALGPFGRQLWHVLVHPNAQLGLLLSDRLLQRFLHCRECFEYLFLLAHWLVRPSQR